MSVGPFPSFPPDPLPPAGGHEGHIIIVGAGMAGLTAAYHLAPSGIRITVVEARDQPGGRVCTLRGSPDDSNGFSGDIYAEAGATFIPGSHSYLVGYVDELGLGPLIEIEPEEGESVFYCRGVEIDANAPIESDKFELNEWERSRAPHEWLIKYSKPGMEAVQSSKLDVRDPNWPGPDLAQFEGTTLYAAWLNAGASVDAAEILRMGYADVWGNGARTFSSLLFFRDAVISMQTDADGEATPHDRWFAVNHGHPSQKAPIAKPKKASGGPLDAGRMYRVKGGMDSIPRAFRKQLDGLDNVDFRFLTPVSRIESDDDDGVTVIAETANGRAEVKGDFVIVTVPIPLLRDIVFEPPLPLHQRHAIWAVPSTPVSRVFLEFEEPVWRKGGRSGVAITDVPVDPEGIKPGYFTSEPPSTPSWKEAKGHAVLEAYINGSHAVELDQLSDDHARFEHVLKELERIFPGCKEAWTGRGMVKSWWSDPWTRGGYCWFRPGELAELAAALRHPLKRIFFCGDSMSPMPGWIQGAMESAILASNDAYAAVTGLLTRKIGISPPGR